MREPDMAYGDDSERIRERAWVRYIEPQIRQGRKRIQMPIKPLMKELEAEGFPGNHPRQFCKALQKRAFLQEKGLIIERLEGPPSGTSTTVVLHFALASEAIKDGPVVRTETPEQRAKRVVAGLSGLLKDEIAAYGGTEAFMRWVRSEEDGAV
jgi:hypothetical protein